MSRLYRLYREKTETDRRKKTYGDLISESICGIADSIEEIKEMKVKAERRIREAKVGGLKYYIHSGPIRDDEINAIICQLYVRIKKLENKERSDEIQADNKKD